MKQEQRHASSISAEHNSTGAVKQCSRVMADTNSDESCFGDNMARRASKRAHTGSHRLGAATVGGSSSVEKEGCIKALFRGD